VFCTLPIGCAFVLTGAFILTGACYDVVTVGVFTAFALKYKHGGLRRLKQQLSQQRHTLPATDNAAPSLAAGASPSPWSRLATITQTVSKLDQLQSATVEACDSLCAMAVTGDPSVLQAAATLLTEQVADHSFRCFNNRLRGSTKKNKPLVLSSFLACTNRNA